jgi:hypothetical protein
MTSHCYPKSINDDKNVKMTEIVKNLILSSSFSVTILSYNKGDP